MLSAGARVVLAVVVLGGVARAEIIDRIMAIVDAEVITLSDVQGAMRLGLVPGEATDLEAALGHLVERQLMLAEADRFGPPEPSPGELAGSIAAVRERFVSQADFDQALRESGLSAEDLRRRVRNDLRIRLYLQQRFGAGLQPGDAEVLSYYESHRADFGGRPFAEVAILVRERLIEEHREALQQQWLAGLRRRASITILPSE